MNDLLHREERPGTRLEGRAMPLPPALPRLLDSFLASEERSLGVEAKSLRKECHTSGRFVWADGGFFISTVASAIAVPVSGREGSGLFTRSRKVPAVPDET
jgi:hypothetical protein